MRRSREQSWFKEEIEELRESMAKQNAKGVGCLFRPET